METRQGKSRKLLWLLLYGGLFALLFAALAATIGIGSPRIPPGVVAIVEEAAPGTGTISRSELDQAMLQSAAIGGQERPQRPGEEGYELAKTEALGSLIGAVWLREQAESMGIVISDREVAAKLAKGGEARSLREEHFTRKTMYERVRGEMLVRRIEATLEREAARRQIENQEAFSEFDRALPETWHPRTHCVEGFVVEACSEYPAFNNVGPPACYEENPKEPAEACPAPVSESPKAQPGSVTPLKPEGEPLFQRPYPEVIEGEVFGG